LDTILFDVILLLAYKKKVDTITRPILKILILTKTLEFERDGPVVGREKKSIFFKLGTMFKNQLI